MDERIRSSSSTTRMRLLIRSGARCAARPGLAVPCRTGADGSRVRQLRQICVGQTLPPIMP